VRVWVLAGLLGYVALGSCVEGSFRAFYRLDTGRYPSLRLSFYLFALWPWVEFMCWNFRRAYHPDGAPKWWVPWFMRDDLT
jgi:hypothetical protein